jgi:hypothetical protein
MRREGSGGLPGLLISGVGASCCGWWGLSMDQEALRLARVQQERAARPRELGGAYLGRSQSPAPQEPGLAGPFTNPLPRWVRVRERGRF